MKRIFKYSIPIEDNFTLELPLGTQILTVQTQKAEPKIWVKCNPNALMVTRHFYLYGTGFEVKEDLFYIGSFQMLNGDMVFHLFEEIK